jgi:uroporphyrinogen-III synthase
MHILITRPEDDAADLKTRIEALGCRVSLAPLIRIDLQDIPESALDGIGALVATSRNGLKALAQSPALLAARKRTLYAVGTGTAELGRHIGFETVITGPGTAAGLIPLIVGDPRAGADGIGHLAGDHLAFDLAAALREHGVACRTIPAYRSVAAETLVPEVAADVAAGRIDAVILMSPRTARSWHTAISLLPAASTGENLIHICLSHAVAEALELAMARASPPVAKLTRKIEIALYPNTEEILALVYRLAAKSSSD